MAARNIEQWKVVVGKVIPQGFVVYDVAGGNANRKEMGVKNAQGTIKMKGLFAPNMSEPNASTIAAQIQDRLPATFFIANGGIRFYRLAADSTSQALTDLLPLNEEGKMRDCFKAWLQ